MGSGSSVRNASPALCPDSGDPVRRVHCVSPRLPIMEASTAWTVTTRRQLDPATGELIARHGRQVLVTTRRQWLDPATGPPRPTGLRRSRAHRGDAGRWRGRASKATPARAWSVFWRPRRPSMHSSEAWAAPAEKTPRIIAEDVATPVLGTALPPARRPRRSGNAFSPGLSSATHCPMMQSGKRLS